MTGLFVAFEGIDGSGKSTPISSIAKRLEEAGHSALVTHEPRHESSYGRQIYDILHGRLPMVSPLALQRLYVIDRLHHVKEEIEPALSRGEIVIADRYWLSTLAFGMLDTSLQTLIDLHEEVFEGHFLKPDLTFLFDLPAEVAIDRLHKIEKGKDHFEKIEKEKRVRENYLRLARADLGDVEVIDATLPLGAIEESISSFLLSRINRVHSFA